jgi:hypothetical protein
MSKVAKSSIGVNGKGDEEIFRGVEESDDGFMAEFLSCTFIMRFSNMSCCFSRGKWSRRMFEVKGDGTNANSNVGKGGRSVEGRWGSRKEANIDRAFVLEVGRDNMLVFKVNVIWVELVSSEM